MHAQCLLDQFLLHRLLDVLFHEFVWPGIESSELFYISFSSGSGARGITASGHVCSTEAEFIAVLVLVDLMFFHLDVV